MYQYMAISYDDTWGVCMNEVPKFRFGHLECQSHQSVMMTFRPFQCRISPGDGAQSVLYRRYFEEAPEAASSNA